VHKARTAQLLAEEKLKKKIEKIKDCQRVRLERTTRKEIAGLRAQLAALQAQHIDLITVLRGTGMAVGGFLPAPVVDVLLPNGSVYTSDTAAADDDDLVGCVRVITEDGDSDIVTTADTTNDTTADTTGDANGETGTDTSGEQYVPTPASPPRARWPYRSAAFVASQQPAVTVAQAAGTVRSHSSSNDSQLNASDTHSNPSNISSRAPAPSGVAAFTAAQTATLHSHSSASIDDALSASEGVAFAPCNSPPRPAARSGVAAFVAAQRPAAIVLPVAVVHSHSSVSSGELIGHSGSVGDSPLSTLSESILYSNSSSSRSSVGLNTEHHDCHNTDCSDDMYGTSRRTSALTADDSRRASAASTDWAAIEAEADREIAQRRRLSLASLSSTASTGTTARRSSTGAPNRTAAAQELISLLQSCGRSSKNAMTRRRASSSITANHYVARHVQGSSSSSSSSATRAYTRSPFELLPPTQSSNAHATATAAATSTAIERRTSLPTATTTSLPATQTFRRRMHSTGAGIVKARVLELERKQQAAVEAAAAATEYRGSRMTHS
jgi:hypothetical protein